MKKIFFQLLTITLFASVAASCSKKNKVVANAKCPLMAINNPAGNIRNFEWVGNKLVRVFSKDSVPTTVVFRYNNKNLAETMEISTSNASEKYVINFIYGDNNLIVKSNVTLNGYKFLTNDFTYNDKQALTIVKTTVELFGKKITGKTRIEYANKNVSKVFSSINDETETLAFVGEKYDDKIQYFPEVYKTAALGFIGIANNFFSYFGENNLIMGKVYDGKGKIDTETKIDYVYTKNGLPVKSETFSTRNGRKATEVCSYNFGCK